MNDFSQAQKQPEINIFSYLCKSSDLKYITSDEKNALDIIYKISNTNLEQLLSTYSKKRLMSFIGAGISEPLGNLTWLNLMKSLRELKPDCAQIDEKSEEMYPDIAEEIYQFCVNQKKESDYINKIKEAVTPRKTFSTSTLAKLVLAVSNHLTTNIDLSLENAYKFVKDILSFYKISDIKWETYCLPNFPTVLKNTTSPCIYYLHGNVKEEKLILRKKEYLGFYPKDDFSQPDHDGIKVLLKQCYIESNILFIGFSFKDIYVKRMFNLISEEYERNQLIEKSIFITNKKHAEVSKILHFLLLPYEADRLLITNRNNKKEYNRHFFDELEKMQIKPIIYKDHTFVEILFDTFINKQKQI